MTQPYDNHACGMPSGGVEEGVREDALAMLSDEDILVRTPPRTSSQRSPGSGNRHAACRKLSTSHQHAVEFASAPDSATDTPSRVAFDSVDDFGAAIQPQLVAALQTIVPDSQMIDMSHEEVDLSHKLARLQKQYDAKEQGQDRKLEEALKPIVDQIGSYAQRCVEADLPCLKQKIKGLVEENYPLRACFAQDDDGKLVFRCPRHHEFVFTVKNHLLALKDSDMWNEKENPRLFALTLRKLREDLLLSQENREDDCRCIICVCVCARGRARAGSACLCCRWH
jgi:hypothetical protein